MIDAAARNAAWLFLALALALATPLLDPLFRPAAIAVGAVLLCVVAPSDLFGSWSGSPSRDQQRRRRRVSDQEPGVATARVRI